jgi:hypothetical protein
VLSHRFRKWAKSDNRKINYLQEAGRQIINPKPQTINTYNISRCLAIAQATVPIQKMICTMGHATEMGVSTQLVLVQVVELSHPLLGLAQVALPTKTSLQAPPLELTHLPQVVLPMKTSQEATLTAELTYLHLGLAQAVLPTMTSHTGVAEPGLPRLPLV